MIIGTFRYRFIALACLFAPGWVGASLEVPEPGFENTWQSGWTVDSVDGGMSSVRAEAARSGLAGLRVNDASASSGSSLSSILMPAVAGRSYDLRFWAKRISGSGLAVYLKFYDSSGTLLTTSSQANEISVAVPSSATSWSPHMLTGTAPPNSAKVRIWVHSFIGSQVVMDLDDFSLVEKAVNLMSVANANPTFETSISPWVLGNSMSSIQASAKRSGSYGLRVVDSSSTQGSDLTSVPIPVSQNSHYILRFWAKIVSGSGMGVYLKFYDENDVALNSEALGNEISTSVPGSASEWKELSLEAVSPPNAVKVKVWLHSYKANQVTAYIDDLCLLRGQGPPAARVSQIAGFMSTNPRGIGKPITDRNAWTGLPQATRDAMVAAGNVRLSEAIPALPDSLYLEFSQTGVRGGYERPYSARTASLSELVLAECATNQGTYLPKINELLTAILGERTWTMPAHDRSLNSFNGVFPIVDLGASMRAWNLATADFLLGTKLSSATRSNIRDQVEERVLRPYVDVVCGRTQYAKLGSWLQWKNNWTAVCHAGVIGSAMALMSDREERAWFIAAAEMHLPFNYLSGFGSDGYCSEGIGYWNYGFSYYTMISEVIGKETGWRVNFYTPPVVESVLTYPRRIELLPGMYPAFSDNNPGVVPSEWVYRLVGRRLVELGRTAVVQGHGRPTVGTKPLSPLYIVMCKAFPRDMASPNADMAEAQGEVFTAPLPARDYFPNGGVFIARHNPSAVDGMAIAIKAGNNAEMHNHNDIGSYVVAYKKKAPLIDPGSEVYSSRTFGPNRYDSDVLNSYGHPVPVVAGAVSSGIVTGKLQDTGAAASGSLSVVSTNNNGTDLIRINLKAAYSQSVPQLDSLSREMRFVRSATEPYIEITDKVEFASPQTFGTGLIPFLHNPANTADPEANDIQSLGVSNGNKTVDLLVQQGEGSSAVKLNVTATASHALRTVKIVDLNSILSGGKVARRVNLDLNQTVTTGQISYRISPVP